MPGRELCLFVAVYYVLTWPGIVSLPARFMVRLQKAEEKGKYIQYKGVKGIDYTDHQSNKLLKPEYVSELEELLTSLHLQMQIG